MSALPCFIVRAAVLCLLALSTWAQQQGAAQSAPLRPRLLDTVFEVQDGDVQDVAGMRVAPADPTLQRVWLAQGRVRAAFAAGTRERLLNEDRRFDSLSPGKHEKLVAVEVDTEGPLHHVYTLTELEQGEKALGTYSYRAAVYREQISAPFSPALPGPQIHAEVPVDFIPAPNPNDARYDKVQDLRPWNADGKLVISTFYALHVFDDQPAAITWRSRAGELVEAWGNALAANLKFGWLGYPDCASAPEKIATLLRFKLADENGAAPGGVIAYCIASPFGYCVKPFPRLVLLADVSAGNWNAPTFDADAGPGRRYVYWNPADKPAGLQSGCTDLTGATCAAGTCPTCIKQSGESVPSFAVFDSFTGADIDVFVDPALPAPGLRGWVACGTERQAQRLDLSNAFANPAHAWNALRINVGAQAPLLKVLADPDQPHLRFVMQSMNSTHVVRFDGLGWITTVLAGESHGEDAGERDIAMLDLPEPSGASSRVLWTAGTGLCDWVHKLVDITANKPGVPKLYDPASTPAVDPQKIPWVAASDGAAAIVELAQARAAVYLATFGGMVRWDPVTLASGRKDYTQWHQVTSTYKPSYPPGGTNTTPTEQVDIPALTGSARRFVQATGDGGFLDWKIDDTTLAFSAQSFVYQVPNWVGAAGWPGAGALFAYGHDAVSFEFDGQDYLAVDLTRQDNSDVALQIYRYVPAGAGSWCLTGVFVQKELVSGLGLPTQNYSLHVSVHVLEPAHVPFAFVGFKGGIVGFDISSAMSCPAGAAPVQSFGASNPRVRLLPPPSSGAIYEAWGVERLLGPGPGEERLAIACDKGAIDTGVFLYSFDPTTGIAGSSPLWQSGPGTFPINAPLSGAFKLRSLPAAGGKQELFVADRAGYLIQMRWSQLAPNQLSYRGHWKSDYGYLVNDCRPYDFGAGLGWMLLVPKDRESFAWVRPYLGP